VEEKMGASDANMILKDAIMVVLITVAPIMTIGLTIGLAISIFQAVTSIQEMTLTYVPKIIISLLCIILFGPWMIKVVVSFSANLISSIPSIVK
jgi:flagellar biosynthesis protein FliQ